ncbi:MAG: TetR/AcrR family transcriptional regulator [Myxococcaceae bacterium]
MTKAAHRLQSDDEIDLKILRAAAKLFREQGFDGTTVREIAKAAQMLPGSLHYRYQSKDEVLVALMRRGTTKAMEAVRAAVANEPDPIERLRYALRAHLKLLIHGDDALYVLLFDWRALPPRSRAGIEKERAKYEAFWDELIALAAMSGRARPQLDLALMRRFSFGAINWVATWHHELDRSSDEIADAYFTYVAYGLLDEHARPKNIAPFFEALMHPKEKK